MVLVAIVGNLGAGKTLALTHILAFNYLLRNRKIYANYHLNSPLQYNHVESVEDIENMEEGVFGGDELWVWLDSRATKTKVNRAISSILLKSRKRGIDIVYTTQAFHQMEKRIRTITDYLIIPELNRRETKCKMWWYEHPNSNRPVLTKVTRFHTAPVFPLYDTKEEVKLLDEQA